MGPTKTRYGRIGVVDYVPDETYRPLIDYDYLSYQTFPEKNLTTSKAFDVLQKNALTFQHCVWRILSNSITSYSKQMSVEEYPKIAHRRVVGVFLDDLLPELHSRSKLWEKHGNTFLERNKIYYEKIGTVCRHGSVLPIFFVRDTMTTTIAKLITQLWGILGFPKKNYSGVFRFYTYTSCLPGKTIESKLKNYKSFPKALQGKLCLVADDLSVADTIRLAKAIGARASYNVLKSKTKDGDYITPKTDLFKALKKHTWKDSPGSSGFPPIVFATECGEEKSKKLLKAFRSVDSTVVFIPRNTNS